MSLKGDLLNKELIAKDIAAMSPILGADGYARFARNTINYRKNVIGVRKKTTTEYPLPFVAPESEAEVAFTETDSVKYIKPYPIKVKAYVTAEDVLDYESRNSGYSREDMRRDILEGLRNRVVQTKNSIACRTLKTGKYQWPVRVANGDYAIVEEAYHDAITSITASHGDWANSTTYLADVLTDIRVIEEAFQDLGITGPLEFYCGREAFDALASKTITLSNDSRINAVVNVGQINVAGRIFYDNSMRFYDLKGDKGVVASRVVSDKDIMILAGNSFSAVNMPVYNTRAGMAPQELFIDAYEKSDGSALIIQLECTPIFLCDMRAVGTCTVCS